ncbi:MAG TPA: hypothetical protein VGG33_24790 [Polyangia bacterium]
MNAREPEPTAVIDYDVVYRDYLRSLVDTLRGFSAGLPGLELWVPHEDERLSLRNLLDVAAAAGNPSLCVRFGSAHRARLTADDLRAVAGPYGAVQILETPDELVVRVEGLHAAATTIEKRTAIAARPSERAPKAAQAISGSTTTVYDKALADTALRHETTGELPGPGLAIAVAHEGARLLLKIDPATHVVTAAGWSAEAPRAAPVRALLDRLCDLAPGLPVLELAYHGVIRLEATLRDEQAARPLPGIVLPATAHPMFALPTALVRAALAAYRTRTGYDETVTRFDVRPASDWLQASLAARLARIEAAVAEPLRLMNLSPNDIHPTTVEHDVRVVFALPDDLPGQQRQRLLLDLEAHIKRNVDPRLELYAEERKDRNKLRRLAVVKDAS